MIHQASLKLESVSALCVLPGQVQSNGTASDYSKLVLRMEKRENRILCPHSRVHTTSSSIYSVQTDYKAQGEGVHTDRRGQIGLDSDLSSTPKANIISYVSILPTLFGRRHGKKVYSPARFPRPGRKKSRRR